MSFENVGDEDYERTTCNKNNESYFAYQPELNESINKSMKQNSSVERDFAK